MLECSSTKTYQLGRLFLLTVTLFLVEMVYDAYKKGFKVKEIPIIFVERTEGDSKMSLKLIFESMFLPWRLKLKAFLRMGPAWGIMSGFLIEEKPIREAGHHENSFFITGELNI